MTTRRSILARRATPKRRAAALAFAAALLCVPTARAQETIVVIPSAPAPKPNPNVLVENTARTVGARQVRIGVLAIEYGIIDRLDVGTDPPVWAVRSVASVLVPNLHLKGILAQAPGAILTARVAGYYANIDQDTVASGHLFALPLSLFASVKAASRTWIHLEGNYNWVKGWGTGDLTHAEIGGALVARTAQLGAEVEVRLTRVVALLARARYQVWSTPLILEGGSQPDPYTNIELSAQLTPVHEHPVMGVGAIALTWTHVGVVAGAGYGQYFAPGINIALPYTGVIPEASLWAAF